MNEGQTMLGIEAYIPMHQKPKRRRNTALESASRAKRYSIGERWEEARKISGISGQEAASRIGIPPSRLTEIEHNQRLPTYEMLAMAVQVYGCNSDYLMGLTDDYDRDAVAAIQRHIIESTVAQYRAVVRDSAEVSYLIMRQAPAFTGQAEKMAQEILRLEEAINSLRAKCPQFDEDMPTSKVVSIIESLSETAHSSLSQLEKHRAAMTVRQSKIRETMSDKSADFWMVQDQDKQVSLL